MNAFLCQGMRCYYNKTFECALRTLLKPAQNVIVEGTSFDKDNRDN